MRKRTLIFCLLATTACVDKGPAGPSAPLNQQFTVPGGDVISITGTPVRLQFVEVTSDSRCPSDVVCVQAGDAMVHLRVLEQGASTDYVLHTSDFLAGDATHRQLRIELLQLAPTPLSNRVIGQRDYRATLKVTAP